jgi:hypothetical protein
VRRARRRSNWSFLQGLPGFARHFNRLCRSNGHFRRARADARVAMQVCGSHRAVATGQVGVSRRDDRQICIGTTLGATDYIQTPNIEGYKKNYRELATRKIEVFRAVGNEPALSAALRARSEHRLAATSRRPLQACIASLPLQSSLMSKTYFKSDHFNGGGSVGLSSAPGVLALVRVMLSRTVIT